MKEKEIRTKKQIREMEHKAMAAKLMANLPLEELEIVYGKEYKAPRPTMGVWRKVIAYDDAKKEKLVDMIDGHIEILALIYGIDADEVRDNIDIADVIPSYLTAVRWVIDLTVCFLMRKKKSPSVSAWCIPNPKKKSPRKNRRIKVKRCNVICLPGTIPHCPG